MNTSFVKCALIAIFTVAAGTSFAEVAGPQSPKPVTRSATDLPHSISAADRSGIRKGIEDVIVKFIGKKAFSEVDGQPERDAITSASNAIVKSATDISFTAQQRLYWEHPMPAYGDRSKPLY